MRAATMHWIGWAMVSLVWFLVLEVSAIRRGVLEDTMSWQLRQIMVIHPFWAAFVPGMVAAVGIVLAFHLLLEYLR